MEGINPTEPYLSQTMLYEKFSCRGFLKKYPENPTFWQKSWSKKVLQMFKKKSGGARAAEGRDEGEEGGDSGEDDVDSSGDEDAGSISVKSSKTYKRYFILDHKSQLLYIYGLSSNRKWLDYHNLHLQYDKNAKIDGVKIKQIKYSDILEVKSAENIPILE